MGVSLLELGVQARSPRGLVTRALWILATVAGLLSLGGAAIVAAALGEPPPAAHDVLYTVLRTRTSLPDGRLIHGTVRLWTDPTSSAALIQTSVPRMVLYYQRQRAGTWIATGRTGNRGRWQVSDLPAAQVPSLLSMDGLRRYFPRLRSRAQQLLPFISNHHLAAPFRLPGLAWRFYHPFFSNYWRTI